MMFHKQHDINVEQTDAVQRLHSSGRIQLDTTKLGIEVFILNSQYDPAESVCVLGNVFHFHRNLYNVSA